jgi:ureidoglycolate hydrolase
MMAQLVTPCYPKIPVLNHAIQCSQCLGSLLGKEWLIAVAPATSVSQPVLEEIAAFCIPGNCFIKLNVGTWHAGPYFDDEFVDFITLSSMIQISMTMTTITFEK